VNPRRFDLFWLDGRRKGKSMTLEASPGQQRGGLELGDFGIEWEPIREGEIFSNGFYSYKNRVERE